MWNWIIYFSFFPIVSSFSPDTLPFDAYGVKLAANDIFLVKGSNSHLTFTLRLAPYEYSLSCSISYKNSNHYVYAVAVQRQATLNNTIRFVFVGINTKTTAPLIGSLTYTGVTGIGYIDLLEQQVKIAFPCTGWQSNNYHIHELGQFIAETSNEDVNNDFFVVTVG